MNQKSNSIKKPWYSKFTLLIAFICIMALNIFVVYFSIQQYKLRYNHIYFMATTIRTSAQTSLAQCNDLAKTKVNIDDLYNKSLLLYYYVQYSPNRDKTMEQVKHIKNLITTTRDMYYNTTEHSKEVCATRIEQIINESKDFQKKLSGNIHNSNNKKDE